jgi:hypothetical protein
MMMTSGVYQAPRQLCKPMMADRGCRDKASDRTTQQNGGLGDGVRQQRSRGELLEHAVEPRTVIEDALPVVCCQSLFCCAKRRTDILVKGQHEVAPLNIGVEIFGHLLEVGLVQLLIQRPICSTANNGLQLSTCVHMTEVLQCIMAAPLVTPPPFKVLQTKTCALLHPCQEPYTLPSQCKLTAAARSPRRAAEMVVRGTCEVFGASGEFRDVNIGRKVAAFAQRSCVDLKDLLPANLVGKANLDLELNAAWPRQRLIEQVRPVCHACT